MARVAHDRGPVGDSVADAVPVAPATLCGATERLRTDELDDAIPATATNSVSGDDHPIVAALPFELTPHATRNTNVLSTVVVTDGTVIPVPLAVVELLD